MIIPLELDDKQLYMIYRFGTRELEKTGTLQRERDEGVFEGRGDCEPLAPKFFGLIKKARSGCPAFFLMCGKFISRAFSASRGCFGSRGWQH
jgi:hypothetical protein